MLNLLSITFAAQSHGMNILILDNYDSYTYNLKQYFEETGMCSVKILKNDQILNSDIDNCDALILSPGPGLPAESGRLMESIHYAIGKKPILGVCLGQQAIAECFGGQLINLNSVFHGISSEIEICDVQNPVFSNLNKEILVGRYHSWVVDTANFPEQLIISAMDKQGYIMALRHRHLPIYAVQFHPESILTPLGPEMIANFLHTVNSGIPSKLTLEL